MPFSLTFRPKLVPTLAALGGVILTAYLGDWQLRRAAYKAELQHHLEQAARRAPIRIPVTSVSRHDIAYAHVEVEGRFLPDRTIFLDNSVRKGQPGYEVVTPLQIEDGGMHILVNRGWVPAAPRRNELPTVAAPQGVLRIEGIALPPRRVFELSSATDVGPVWQNLHLEKYAERYGIELQPVVIQQQNGPGDGLVRDWPRPEIGVNMHRAYALQWFTMCAAIALLYVILNVKRNHRTLDPV